MGKKKEFVFISIGEYPSSWHTTPDEVKEVMYDLQYRLLRTQEPFVWQNEKTGETFEDDSWSEESLRNLAEGMVQARLGWGKTGVSLRVSKKDARKIRYAKKSAGEVDN